MENICVAFFLQYIIIIGFKNRIIETSAKLDDRKIKSIDERLSTLRLALTLLLNWTIGK